MAQIISGDFPSILASYNPPDTSFEVPSEPEYAQEEEEEVFEVPVPASTDSRSGTEAVPYSLTEISPTTRTLKVTHIDLLPGISDAGVRGMVTNVSHGTFDSKPATLIVFSFSLRSGQHGYRFKNANIKITFSKHSSAPSSEASPAVVKFAPRKMYGLPTVEGKKNRIGGEFSLEVPAGPITVGPSISGEKEWEYEKTHRFSTQGNFWSSEHGSDWDIVYWDVRENKRTKEGIPDQLNMGVVVERGGKFVATVDVTVDTPVANSVFGSPWRKNAPALFAPGVTLGKQPSTTKFDDLTEEEWRRMVPFDGEWENRFIGSAMRMAKVEKSAPVTGSTLNFDPEFL
ncbi:hypothetical protein LSUE1_G004973 [Lachnellula suecica]|uniref:Uncharacterized protein n=1 Tax=Lachnellula suecica TaxID=602035 RepID=A0A8T9CBD3_9HELO|nr:hypothetical protein LSUE1_G004973 [Lachnellula suecica]